MSVYKTTEQIQVSFWLFLHFNREKANKHKNNSDNPSNWRQHAEPAKDSVPPAQDEWKKLENMTGGERWIL